MTRLHLCQRSPADWHPPQGPARARQRGVSLVELMVALAIGLFILLGLSTIFLQVKSTFVAQDRLALLQDNERLALTILTATVRSAGYFTDPVNNSAAAELPTASGAYGNLAAGQGLVGQAGAPGRDTLTSRYRAPGGHSVLVNCLGEANTMPTPQVFINTYSVSADGDLLCSTDGGATSTPLVSGIAAMAVLYGADTDGTAGPDRYLSAAEVAAGALWPQVRSVRLTLAFRNPFAGQPGQPATVDWVQTIDLMNRT